MVKKKHPELPPDDLPFTYMRGLQFDYRSLMPNFIIILNYKILDSTHANLTMSIVHAKELKG